MATEGTPAEGLGDVTPTPEEMHQRGLAAAAALPADGATPTETTPLGEQPADAATTEVDSFTKLDPSTLPPEMLPYYKSLQADHTRKTQEAAPFRSLAEETGLDADGLRSAAELYSTLQDPTALVDFYQELTSALEAQGLTPAQAAEAATTHVEETLQPGGLDLDPEEARIQELTSRLDKFEAGQRAAAEEVAKQQRANAFVANMNQMEAAVRESHPDWTQEDIDAVYELSAFHGADLVKAADRFDEIVSNRVTRILNGKGAAQADPANAPFPGAVSGLSRGVNFGDDLNAAHKAAMEAAKLL